VVKIHSTTKLRYHERSLASSRSFGSLTHPGACGANDDPSACGPIIFFESGPSVAGALLAAYQHKRHIKGKRQSAVAEICVVA
jgi:hypothetical protein